ncbi:MAG TPA: hypothetical protein P5526_31035 [Anaerolineae bacterium]|nr:hypothetical protein [Anaerolineae bacterium]MCB0222333.1 hypothetical protein [Anaerolineae bacterium]MCB9106752.1 hypothetical protein [Anaerolineales bacterium]HRV96632.1 hypothetical protein [Anaerolineae bacterium]
MNNKLNAKILLIIVILVVPLSCLALAIASVFVGFGLTAATSASGPVDPEAVEAEIINIAAQYAETNDLATAQQQLADLNLPNTNQYISFMADRYIQENAGTDDPNTQHLFVLASALGVGTESMALALATPTPIPTDTPVPTDTPTVVAEEVVAEEMAAVEVAAAEDQQPTDTPEPTATDTSEPEPPTETPIPLPTNTPAPPTDTPEPTATPEPTRPPVDFVVAEAYLIPNPVYNSCPGAHQIYVTVVDVNGNPIDGATVEDTFRVVPPHVSGEKGPGKLEYDLWDNGFSLEVTKKADGSPATSEVTPKLSSWDEDIPDEWLVQANYCLDIADCVARKGHNQLCRGHYAYNVTFQKAY